MARRISARTAAELADYAAAGRMGERPSGGSKAGPWVFGLTLFSIFLITTFQACQRQLSIPSLGQRSAEQSITKVPANPKAQRSEPRSPATGPASQVSPRPAKPQSAPNPGSDVVIAAPASRPEMWRDPRSHASRQSGIHQ